MILRVLSRVTELPVWAHLSAGVATLGFFQWVKGHLDASYAAAKHPVDYFTGQTTFSGPAVKGYYAQMLETGTLDVYWTTQVIDYGFIFAIICIGTFVATLFARISRKESVGRRIGLLGGASLCLGAICDAIENAWSFLMLANPTDFPDWLALPYSAFASVKFGFITLGMALVLISLLCAVLGRVLGKPRIG